MHYVIFDILNLQYVFRIILAGLCGLLIGYERKSRAKEAGIRTHFVVCCGAALIMFTSKYGFSDAVGAGTRGADASRIAAQIVSGVGFLGAGIIFVQKRTVTGLTTAAGIWATSGIGMAIGAGMYSVGVFSTLIILTGQIVLHKNSRFMQMPKVRTLKIKSKETKGFQSYAAALLRQHNISVPDVGISKPDGKDYTVYEFEIEFSPEIQEEKIIGLFECECSIKPYR